MFKNIVTTSALLLLAGQALASFEIKDPAAEFYEQQSDDADGPTGKTLCVDFLRDGADEAESYGAKLAWMQRSFDGVPSGAELEPALRSLCIDHPKHSLKQAAEALGGTKAQ